MQNELNKIHERLESLDRTLLRNTLSLEEHMRRSAANEKAIEILRDEIKPISKKLAIVDALLVMIPSTVALLVGLKSLGILKI